MQVIEENTGKEKIVFVINPVSGVHRRQHIKEIILKNLDKKIFDPEFKITRYKGHATKIVKKSLKKGVKIIVAVGGDGTINEVASLMVGTKCSLGIIPNGSGNGLARYLRIPLSQHEAVRLLNNGNIKKIDTGKVNNKYFFCTCGIGFDAHIGKVFDRLESRGFINYFKTVLKEYFSYSPKKYKFSIDGKKFMERAFLITFANAGQYGNNAYISPGAKIDDGLLDICVMKPFPRIKSAFLGLRLFSRTIDRSKYLQVYQGREITVKRKKKYTIHIDGDPVKMNKSIKIRLLPKALRIIVPK